MICPLQSITSQIDLRFRTVVVFRNIFLTVQYLVKSNVRSGQGAVEEERYKVARQGSRSVFRMSKACANLDMSRACTYSSEDLLPRPDRSWLCDKVFLLCIFSSSFLLVIGSDSNFILCS